MNRTRPTWVALALPLVLGLSSCVPQLPSTKVAVAPPAKSGARVGGTLRVGITPPGGIEPVNAYEPMGKLIVSTMCDTPIALDPETGQVREALAKTIIQSRDGTTITTATRRGLKFHDGTPFRPKTLDESYQLLKARGTASYLKSLLTPWEDGLAGVLGKEPPKDDSPLADDDPGLFTKPRSIVAGLNESDWQMFSAKGNGGAIRALAEPAFAPIASGAQKRDPVAFARSPICIGPYKLAKPYLPGATSISLVRDPGYHAKNVAYTGGGRGYVDRIDFMIFKTAELAYAAYAQDVVDVVAVPPAKAADALRFGSALVSGRAKHVEFLGMPTALDPYGSVELRRALSLALDRKALAAVLGPEHVPASGFIPPALELLPGDHGVRKNQYMEKPSKGLSFEGCPDFSSRDVTRAKKLLAEAFAAQEKNFADDPRQNPLAKPLAMYVNPDGRYEAMARLAAKQWKEALGLDVVVKPLRWADYLQKATQGPGFDAMFRMSWSTDATWPEPVYHDVPSFLGPVFLGLGKSNWAKWVNREFDFFFSEDLSKETDHMKRNGHFRSLEDILCDDLPMLPVSFAKPQFLVRDTRLASARQSFLHIATGMPLLREIYYR